MSGISWFGLVRVVLIWDWLCESWVVVLDWLRLAGNAHIDLGVGLGLDVRSGNLKSGGFV